MARSRAVLAWNPTQFTLGHSERVLLSMAAGAATLTDDRPSVRTQLGTSVATHRSGDLADLRAQAERLLGDPAHAAQLAHAGRREAERAHLWEHRLQMIGSVVAEVLGRSTQPGST
jgi:spore maturation protein CgeB